MAAVCESLGVLRVKTCAQLRDVFNNGLQPHQASFQGAMIVGILQVELTIDWAGSLKDKRRVVSSVKQRLHREHMVSVAEVDTLDSHRVATLGITVASNSVRHVQSVLDRITNKLRHERDCVLSDQSTQILTST